MPIKLSDIKERTALELLSKYKGKNPYIKKLKRRYSRKNKLKLTETQAKYIQNNFDKDPLKLDKLVEITEYLGKELQKKDKRDFLPKKVMIEYMLGETEKSYHVYGKLSTKQKSKMYWLPKTQVLDDPYFQDIDIEVDFDKYKKLDTFELSDGTIGRTPYNHQKEGIKFLLSRNGCILADQMGLGKTYQAIIAALEKDVDKVLIVCPSSLKINWEREIKYFQCDETSIINGRKWNPSKFTIINYDILKNFHTLKSKKSKDDLEGQIVFNRELANEKFDLVIIDEAHYLKNHKSIRGKIMQDLCVKHGIDIVWLLTGTPIANRPMDFYNLLKLIKAPIVDNWMFYAKRYCDARRITTTLKSGKKKKVWLTNGASNLEELHKRTKNIMLRRKKEDVLDMPDKTVTRVMHKLTDSQWDEYNSLWEEYIENRRLEGKRGNPQRDLVELILLRKFIAMINIQNTIEQAEIAIEEGNKVIIFTTFTDELEELQEHFGKKCVVHYGPMNDSEKQRSVDKFQKNKSKKVFIGNIKSAGVGITLTEGSVVIFNSFDWVPGNNEQAEDRSHRVGQKDNVNIYYHLFENTISESMWWVLQKKREVISSIMGEKGDLDEEKIMVELMNLVEDDD